MTKLQRQELVKRKKMRMPTKQIFLFRSWFSDLFNSVVVKMKCLKVRSLQKNPREPLINVSCCEERMQLHQLLWARWSAGLVNSSGRYPNHASEPAWLLILNYQRIILHEENNTGSRGIWSCYFTFLVAFTLSFLSKLSNLMLNLNNLVLNRVNSQLNWMHSLINQTHLINVWYSTITN